MNIYPPNSIDESKYKHLEQSDLKKIFCTYLTFNKTTLEWYGGETTLYKHSIGYAGSGTGIEEHFTEWKKKLCKNWKNNFICLLDECFETKTESLSREAELVNNETRDELCINRLNGGGGWDYGDEFPEEVRENFRLAQLKYHRDTPKAREKNSQAQLKYFRDNPNAREKNSQAQLKYWNDNPEKRLEKSNIMTEIWSDPTIRKRQSENQIKIWSNPELRKKHSEQKKQFHKDNPGILKGIYKRDDVPTQFIIELIIKETKIKRLKLVEIPEWRNIAKKNNCIGNFWCRIPEINKILGTDCITTGDVFKHIANEVLNH